MLVDTLQNTTQQPGARGSSSPFLSCAATCVPLLRCSPPPSTHRRPPVHPLARPRAVPPSLHFGRGLAARPLTPPASSAPAPKSPTAPRTLRRSPHSHGQCSCSAAGQRRRRRQRSRPSWRATGSSGSAAPGQRRVQLPPPRPSAPCRPYRFPFFLTPRASPAGTAPPAQPPRTGERARRHVGNAGGRQIARRLRGHAAAAQPNCTG